MPLAYRIVICYIDLTSVVLDKNTAAILGVFQCY